MSDTNILIVEDESIVAADLERKLKKIGYGVAGIASRGEQAVEMSLSLKPQLVLMDIRIEGTMDGIETAEAIRSRCDVPIVYLTAHSDRATFSRAKMTGPFGYILKPYDDRELVTQIELGIYKHNVEMQLHQQREWLRVILASIGEAVVAVDTNGSVAFMNAAAESLTGWSMDAANGKPLEQVFHLIDKHTGKSLTNQMENLLDSGKISSPSSHWLLVRKDEAAIPVWCSGAPIRDQQGRLKGLVVVFRDISLQRKAEEKKDALISELKAAMSKVQMLSGLLPICASCKKIRDDRGYWNRIESYIRSHSEAEFSHGICPDCAKELYPELHKNDPKKKRRQ